MKTKTKIEEQLRKKTSSTLVETIISAKKNKKWNEIAGVLSGPKKNRKNLNLYELDKLVGKEKKVLVTGKILSEGELNHKFKIVANSFSEKAREKLLKNGCDVSTILEEIKLNPSAEGIKIIK